MRHDKTLPRKITSSSNLKKETNFLSLFRPTFHVQPSSHNRKIIRNLANSVPTSSNVCANVSYIRKKFRFIIQLYVPRILLEQQRGREEDGRQGSSTRNPIHRAYSKRIGVSPSSVRPPSTLPFSLIPSSISQHTYTHTCTTVQRASSTILHQQSIMAAEFLTRASAPATSAKTSGDRYVRAQRITTPATREPVT